MRHLQHDLLLRVPIFERKLTQTTLRELIFIQFRRTLRKYKSFLCIIQIAEMLSGHPFLPITFFSPRSQELSISVGLI